MPPASHRKLAAAVIEQAMRLCPIIRLSPVAVRLPSQKVARWEKTDIRHVDRTEGHDTNIRDSGITARPVRRADAFAIG